MANYILLWLLLSPFALAFLLHYLARKVAQGKGASRSLLPPSPKGFPIIGNLHQLGKLPHHSLLQLSRSHGPVMYLKLGSVPTVVVSSAEMAREVMKTRDLDFCSRPQLHGPGKMTYQNLDVSFSPYGEYWRNMRKLCMVELFNAKRVQSFHFVRKEEIHLMIESITSADSTPVDLSEMMVNFANDVICRVAFGRKYRQEDAGMEGRLHRILKENQNLLSSIFLADYFPCLGWIDRLTGLESTLDRNCKELDALYEKVIQEHLDLKRMSLKHENIVDVLLELKANNVDLSMDSIKAVLTDLFIAGTETGAATIVWAMSELMRKPRLMRKAQEEIRTIVGTNGRVEEHHLHQFQFLKAVIKETFRLHNPAPLLLPRESIRHSKIGGYDVLPGTRVLVNAYAIGRDPNSWEDHEQFIPERFIGSSIDFRGQDFELIPFGSGRRICPALNFGTINVEFTLASLLYSFKWELPKGMKEEDIDMEEAPGLVVHKKFPLLLVAKKYM